MWGVGGGGCVCVWCSPMATARDNTSEGIWRSAVTKFFITTYHLVRIY